MLYNCKQGLFLSTGAGCAADEYIAGIAPPGTLRQASNGTTTDAAGAWQQRLEAAFDVRLGGLADAGLPSVVLPPSQAGSAAPGHTFDAHVQLQLIGATGQHCRATAAQ